jgi:hypothetical protein
MPTIARDYISQNRAIDEVKASKMRRINAVSNPIEIVGRLRIG